jgi:hypothetical protein
MIDPTRAELLRLTQELLDAIARGDWKTYEELCDPTLTAIEPEALGQCVEGLAFHRFYFDRLSARNPGQVTMCDARVRLLGDVGVVSYVRLIQRVTDGSAATTGFAETRVWQRQGERWRHVHFHRSKLGE